MVVISECGVFEQTFVIEWRKRIQPEIIFVGMDPKDYSIILR